MPNDTSPAVPPPEPLVEYRDPRPVRAALDPLRYCVMTTVALLAWWLGPAVVLAMAAMGIWAYGGAIRGGLTRSRCVLRRPRLVVAYLALAALAALGALAGTLAR